MKPRPERRKFLPLVVSAAVAAAMVVAAPAMASGQTATSGAPSSTPTSIPNSASPSTAPLPATAGPPSQGTPPEERRDKPTPAPQFTTMSCQSFWNHLHGRNYALCGRILNKYTDLGGPGGFLGAPTSNELLNPDGVGKRASFQSGSSIYFHPDTDAHQIGGRIGDKWAEFGFEGGTLGYPITDELTNPDGGKRQAFQNDSSIYYKNEQIGAHQIGGDIGKRWGDLGWESSYLGYPITDEISTPNGAARLNHFESGSIYWSGYTGARDLTTEMISIWAAYGYEAGSLGLPTSNTRQGSPDISPLNSPDNSELRAAGTSRPQETVFQGGIGVVGYGDEGYVQLPDRNNPTPVNSELLGVQKQDMADMPEEANHNQGDKALNQPDGAEMPEVETMATDGPSAIEDTFPALRCDTWSPLPISYSYLRKGQYSYGEDSGFGRVKAQLKHNIGYGDGTNLDSLSKVLEVKRVWNKTLATALLDGGCNSAKSNSHRGVFDTRFLGLTCVWGGRACLPDPRENVTVRAVEEMKDSDNVPNGDKKAGNVSLHCLNEDKSEDCPNWLPRAAPFMSIN